MVGTHIYIAEWAFANMYVLYVVSVFSFGANVRSESWKKIMVTSSILTEKQFKKSFDSEFFFSGSGGSSSSIL